jgi:hypothetical protein
MHGKFPGTVCRLLGVAAGLGIVASGCGVTAHVSAPSAPSQHTLDRLFKAQHIVKHVLLRWKAVPPEELVVSEDDHDATLVHQERLSVLRFQGSSHGWRVIWTSPILSAQQSLLPDSRAVVAPVSAMKVLRQGSRGELVALLTPASLGASSLWNDALLAWVPARGKPQTLWAVTQKQTDMLDDGTITRSSHALLVSEDACWGVKATLQSTAPRVQHPSCTQLLKAKPGERLPFFITGPDHHATPRQPQVTVSRGSTVVFWPANQSARRLVNSGTLTLWGGPADILQAGKIPINDADSLGLWQYRFTSPGDYVFALVSTQKLTDSVTASATWTVHVRR